MIHSFRIVVTLGMFLMFFGCSPSPIEEGNQFAQSWQLNKALEQYKIAYQADSTNIELINNMGSLLINLEYYPDAMVLFDKSLLLKADFLVEKKRKIAGQLSNGFTAIHQSDYEKAIIIYQQILQLDQDLVIAHKNLAYCYIATEDTNSAISEFMNVKKLLSDYPASDLYQVADEEISQLTVK